MARHPSLRYLAAMLVIAAGVAVYTYRLRMKTYSVWESVCISEERRIIREKYPTAAVGQIDAVTSRSVSHRWGVDHWTGNDVVDYFVTVTAVVKSVPGEFTLHADCKVETDSDSRHVYDVKI
jgi:hypothetical protein